MLVVLVVAAWLLVAPTQIGGETSYVTTSGISMAPRFHSGDLGVVRPAADYRVGDVIAYRSDKLHLVVLHRIIGVKGGRFVTKGDNNDFVDPDHPARADVVGKLAFRVAHGGMILKWLHSPLMAALLSGGLGVMLFVGAKRHRRRRDRRRPTSERGTRQLEPLGRARDRHSIYETHEKSIFTTCAVVALVCLAFGALAFTRPTTKPSADKTPYTEKVSFGYHAKASAGPVYPDGVVSTGDPIFVKLVHDVHVKAHYRLQAKAPHHLGGTMELVLNLSSPTGWSRTIQLAAPKRFTGDYAAADATLDVQPAAVADPQGREAHRQLRGLSLQRRGHAARAPGRDARRRAAHERLRAGPEAPARSAEAPSRHERVLRRQATPRRPMSSRPRSTRSAMARCRPSTTQANTLTIHDVGVSVPTARWLAVIGLLLGVAGTLITGAGVLRDPYDPTKHVDRYRHLIVPIAGTTFDPARPPIDVTSIGALAQLAERSERLILHHQREGVDTYLVDDEGTLYRYQAHSHLRQIPALSVVDGAVYEPVAR